ncbi:MAG: ankyrin repeat domain-containing protein [Alphaproteobacteria bacterium]
MTKRQKFNKLSSQAQQEQLEKHFFDCITRGDAMAVADFLRDCPGAVRWQLIKDNDPLGVAETALHVAARMGKLGVAQELLNASAPVDAKDSLDQTPLMSAAQFGRTDVMACLLENRADPAAVMTEGTTALMFAARNGPLESAQMLLDKGADVNQTDEGGDTALFFALHLEDNDDAYGMLRVLLEKGADMNLKNGDGFTVTDFAREEGKRDLANFIEDYAEQLDQAQEWEAEQAKRRDIEMMKTASPPPFRWAMR